MYMCMYVCMRTCVCNIYIYMCTHTLVYIAHLHTPHVNIPVYIRGRPKLTLLVSAKTELYPKICYLNSAKT